MKFHKQAQSSKVVNARENIVGFTCDCAGRGTPKKFKEMSHVFCFRHLNMTGSDLHIGNLIKEELKRQDRSIAWLSRQVFCDRSNLSRVLKSQYIDIYLLRRISISLKYNFFKNLSDFVQQEMENKNGD